MTDATAVQLVADVIEATQLVPEERLALVRGTAETNGRLAEALVSEGVATSAGLARLRALRFGLPFVDIAAFEPDPAAVEPFPVELLREVRAVPYRLDGDVVRVAVADPGDLYGMDKLQSASRYRVELAVGPADGIDAVLARLRLTF